MKKGKEKRKYVARPDLEPRTPDLRVGCPTDCATLPGCTLSVRNVIYHKFSHCAAFYTLNGKNVNVMLEILFLSVFLVSNLQVLAKFHNLFSKAAFIGFFSDQSVHPLSVNQKIS